MRYIKKVEKTVMALDQRYRDTLGDTRFDALTAAQTVDRGALLHYFYAEGLSYSINEYKVLGSGEQYGTIFLIRFWKREKSMEEIAGLGHFIVKYIEKFELNSQVGGEPQICFIPDKGQLYNPSVDQYTQLNKNTQEKLAKHSSNISDLNF